LLDVLNKSSKLRLVKIPLGNMLDFTVSLFNNGISVELSSFVELSFIIGSVNFLSLKLSSSLFSRKIALKKSTLGFSVGHSCSLILS